MTCPNEWAGLIEGAMIIAGTLAFLYIILKHGNK